MQVVIRGNVVHLIRSTYERFNKVTGTGGRSRSHVIAKFPTNSIEIPDDIRPLLASNEDVEKVMTKVIYPARKRAAQDAEAAAIASRAADERERDPMPRIENAMALLCEAEELASKHDKGLPAHHAPIGDAICSLVRIGLQLSGAGHPVASTEFILASLTKALHLAANKISEPDFPMMEDGLQRDNSLTAIWREVEGAIESVRWSMQAKRYVKARRPKALG